MHFYVLLPGGLEVHPIATNHYPQLVSVPRRRVCYKILYTKRFRTREEYVRWRDDVLFPACRAHSRFYPVTNCESALVPLFSPVLPISNQSNAIALMVFLTLGSLVTPWLLIVVVYIMFLLYTRAWL